VARAQREARSLHHERVGTEHLAVGLFGDAAGLACEILDSLGIGVDDVRARIPEGTSEAASGQLPFEPETKRVLELALREALALGHAQIGTEHLLLGLLRDEDAPGGALLRERGADYAEVRSAIAAAAGPPVAFVEWGPAGGASWEYRVAEISGPLEEELDDLARELPGWELVSLTGQAPELRAILKRRAA
jgi:ATP-dependent Clp protease ATP-binding subunit ClpA